MTSETCDARVVVEVEEMAAERLGFHEMGLDDRLLKVTNVYTTNGA